MEVLIHIQKGLLQLHLLGAALLLLVAASAALAGHGFEQALEMINPLGTLFGL